MSFLLCPNCKTPLSKSSEKSYTCINKHNFDIAKQGYLNLIPVNKKNSKEPGDNEMMIAARREFLELGFYDQPVKGIRNIISNELVFETKNIVALDAGCGEGYYSEKVFHNLPELSAEVYGTDISKFAVKNASSKYKSNFYFVSSVYDLPVADESTDLILSVFSPIMPEEFNRILNNKGFVIAVSPAPNHLREIAELIYDKVKPHISNVVENMTTLFKHKQTKRTSFTIDIKNADDLLALLKMTPYYWSTGKERLENITNKKELSITCDFNIDVFSK